MSSSRKKWTGTYDPHEIGVWYDSSAGEWGIFNEDGTAIPAGSSFNVNVDNPNLVGSPPILQQATSANTSSYITYIDNPNLNGNPNLVLHATQVYNANGQCGCMYNNHQIGVWYNARNGRWSVYNVDRAPMPAGAEFFVLYGPPFN